MTLHVQRGYVRLTKVLFKSLIQDDVVILYIIIQFKGVTENRYFHFLDLSSRKCIELQLFYLAVHVYSEG